LIRTDTATRRAVRVPVRIGTVVNVADEIQLPPNGAITVSGAEGPARRIDGPGTFHIPPGRELGAFRRIVEAFSSIFDVDYRTAATAVSRGTAGCTPASEPSPIAVPILRPAARIVAGLRDIPLAWTGGCPPYRVTLSHGETVLARREDIVRAQQRLDGVTLVAGTTYAVTIVDARGTRRAIDLTVVSAAPVPPSDLAADASPIGIVARAVAGRSGCGRVAAGRVRAAAPGDPRRRPARRQGGRRPALAGCCQSARIAPLNCGVSGSRARRRQRTRTAPNKTGEP
jgi:hypothetical protein